MTFACLVSFAGLLAARAHLKDPSELVFQDERSFLDSRRNELYDMVSAGNDCIRWAQDGTSFWIGAPDALESTVLPRFFKHNRMAFFVKQLKAYGFCAKRGASCLDVSKEWFHKVTHTFLPRQFRAIRARSSAQFAAARPSL